MIKREFRKRTFAEIVRFEIDNKMPADLKAYLLKHFKVKKNDIFEMDGPIGLADTMELTKLSGFSHLKEPAWNQVLNTVLRHASNEAMPSAVKVIQKEDFYVHHQYHSFETSTQRLMAEAAVDP